MEKRIAIIDYKVGNVASIANAVRVLGCTAVVTHKKSEIEKSNTIILPGVGAFETGMTNLKKFGLIDVLEEEVFKRGKPILGICLGMQLFAEESLENGSHKGLGWIKGCVRRLPVGRYRLPHIGWNDIVIRDSIFLFDRLERDYNFYFLHSYFLDCTDKSIIKATSNYGSEFTAVVEFQNIVGTQFHPEKSQRNGLIVLYNFLHCDRNRAYVDPSVVVDGILNNALSDDRLVLH